jgi:hypothetical protein
MKGVAASNKNICSDITLLSDSDPVKGPRPWTAPQIDRKATKIIDVLIPINPKRKADHNSETQ